MAEVKREAERRKVELLIVPTARAIEELRRDTEGHQCDPARDLLIVCGLYQVFNVQRRERLDLAPAQTADQPLCIFCKKVFGTRRGSTITVVYGLTVF